jgi:enoyl-CoA hydratase/carnithine racemase
MASVEYEVRDGVAIITLNRAVAMDILLTCSTLSADRAYQLGLVSRLVRSGSVIDAAMDGGGKRPARGEVEMQHVW